MSVKGLGVFCCGSVYFILFGGWRAHFQVMHTTLPGYMYNHDYTIVISLYYHKEENFLYAQEGTLG